MKQPIRKQLLLPLLAVLSAAALGVAACSSWINWSRQATLLQQQQANVVLVLEESTFPLTRQVLQQMARLSGQQFVVWDSVDRRVVAASREGAPQDLAVIVERVLPAPAATASITWGDDRYAVGRTRLKHQPGVQVLVLTSQRSLIQAWWAAVWPPFALGAGALLLLVPWVLALTRGWARRIEGIQRSVAQIADGDWSLVPSAGDCDDELSALVADIDRLRLRLHELQGELVQSERERLVAQLAAGFAHQFRNGVAGASLALQLHASRCPVPAERSLLVAQKQLTLLEVEIRGMLSLAKRGGDPLEVMAISEIVRDAVELVMPAVEHHRIALHNDSGECSESIRGSRAGLRAALLNLLQNAIDACGPGGAIRIAAEAVGTEMVFRIADNGAGPRADVSANMTEAFVTTKPEGLGLGLTVVAAVAHDHGGRLSWRRDDGWTIVELWLPVAAGQGVHIR